MAGVAKWLQKVLKKQIEILEESHTTNYHNFVLEFKSVSLCTFNLLCEKVVRLDLTKTGRERAAEIEPRKLHTFEETLTN